jgi:hypothetical protein
MKKVILLSSFMLIFVVFAKAQCTIDPNNTDFLSPAPNDIPCIVRNVPYSEVLQIYIPAQITVPGIPLPVTVDSIVITGLTGLPNGITWAMNPANGVIRGGNRGCGTISGTTSDPAGNYPITVNGTAHAFGQTFPLDQPPVSDFFVLYLDVIEQGSNCRMTTSLSEKSDEMAVSVYPNPTSGLFTIVTRAEGDVALTVVDFTGKQVYQKNANTTGVFAAQVDLSHLPKGIYAVRLQSAKGIITKNVLVE